MRLLTSLLTLILLPAVASAAPPERHSLRLPARDVVADARLPLPASGVVYVFAQRAMRLRQLQRAPGLRYLGVVGRGVYAMQRMGGATAALQAWLEAQDEVVGTALADPEDRLDAALRARFGQALPVADAPLAEPLRVRLWAGTPTAEALAAFPEAAAQLHLPPKRSAPIGAQNSLRLEGVDGARLRALTQLPIVAQLSPELPQVLFNEASRRLSNAVRLASAPYQLDGAGVLVGEWDGGFIFPHPDFGDRVTNYRQTVAERDSLSKHASHVAGTVLGAGGAAVRGYAPAAKLLAGSMYHDVIGERSAARHQYYHEHDTHSWGNDPDYISNFGVYDWTAAAFDNQARDLLMLAVKAAGNEGYRGTPNDFGVRYDSLSPNSTQENAIIVGSVSGEGVLSGTSSRGPTEDGRVKPDLMADGEMVRSIASADGYEALSGTSMATPGVTGVVTLIAQLHKSIHGGRRWAPDVARGVLIHTARDIEDPGPDYLSGWGIVDAKAAADLLLADGEQGGRITRGSLREGETKEFQIEVPAGQPELRVTLTWLDSPRNVVSDGPVLLHDLDLEVLSPSGGRLYPYALDRKNPSQTAVTSGPNRVDNVEQVRMVMPVEGTWTVRVHGHSISHPDLPDQGFVLVSSQPVANQKTWRVTASLPDQGRPIPTEGLTEALTFPAAAVMNGKNPARILDARVYVDVQTDDRSQLSLSLLPPSGPAIPLKAASSGSGQDLFAIYPDTKPASGDLRALFGQAAGADWKVQLGGAGTLRNLTLELVLSTNTAPTAQLTAPVQHKGGLPLSLQAQATDPDGDPLSYHWSIDDPALTIPAQTGAELKLSTPRVQTARILNVQLEVDDGRGGRAHAKAAVQLLPNQPPTVSLPAELAVRAGGGAVVVEAIGDDPDGDPLSYRWRPAADNVKAFGDLPAQASLELTLPAGEASYSFTVTVSDGLDEVEQTIRFQVAPSPKLLKASGSSCQALQGPAQVHLLLLLGLLGLRRRRR